MANNDPNVLIDFGYDPEQLAKVIAEVSKQLQTGIKKSLDGIDFGALIQSKFTPIKVKLDLSNAKTQIEEFQKGLKPLEISVKAVSASGSPTTTSTTSSGVTFSASDVDLRKFTAIPAQFDRINAILAQTYENLKKLGASDDQAADSTKRLYTELGKLTQQYQDIQNVRKANSELAGQDVGFTKSQLTNLKLIGEALKELRAAASGGGIETSFQLGNTISLEQLTAASTRLREELTLTSASLLKLQEDLKTQGLEESVIAKKTQTFENNLTGIKVKLDQIDTGLKETNPNFTELASSINSAGKSLDTYGRKIGEVDAKQVAFLTKSQQTDAFFKNFAFSVGLVGYGMENLGRRFLGFSQILFNFLQTSAQTTENIQRMRNALIVQGVPEGERNSIEDRILKIANLPTGKLDTVTKAFKEFTAAGLSADQALTLLAGIQKGAAVEGKAGGAEASIEAIQRALISRDSPFPTKKSVGGLEADVGDSVRVAFEKVAGGIDTKSLTAAGGKALILSLSEELSKINEGLPVTADRMNRIENILTVIKADLLELLGPALDKLLDKLESFQKLSARIKTTFDSLAPATKDWISGLISAIPVLTTVVGVLLSFFGVLAVGIAVFGKLSNAYSNVITKLASSTGVVKEEFSLIGAAGTKLTSIFEPVVAFFSKFATIFSAGEGGITVSLAAFEGTLEGIGLGLAKISGLIPGLGTVIQIILGYILNINNARDTVNSAFGDIINSFKHLYDSIVAFGGTKAGGIIYDALVVPLLTVLDTLTQIAGFLTSAVGFVVGLVADVLDLVAGLLDVFNSTSIHEALVKLEDTLLTFALHIGQRCAKIVSDAVLGGVRVLGAALVRIGVASQATIDQTIKNVEQWQKENLDTNLVVKNGEITLSKYAATMAKTATNTQVAQTATGVLNSQLRETNEILEKMDKIINSVNSSFQKAKTGLTLQDVKFQASQDLAQGKADFDKLIKANPFEAQKQLSGFLDTQTQTSTKSVAFESKSELTELAKDITDAANAIKIAGNNLPSKLITSGILGQDGSIANLGQLIKLLYQLADAAKAGKIDFTSYEKGLQTFTQAYEGLQTSLKGKGLSNQSEETKKNVADFLRDLESGKEVLDKLTSTLSKRSGAEQTIAQDRIKAMEEFSRQIKEVIKQLEALERVKPLKTQLEGFNQELITQQQLLATAQSEGATDRVNALNAHILQLKNQIADKELEISKAGEANRDIVKETGLANERELKGVQLTNESYRARIKYLEDINKLNEQAAQTAVQTRSDIFQKFVEQDKERATLGLQPDLTSGESVVQLTAFRDEVSKLTDELQSTPGIISAIGNGLTGFADQLKEKGTLSLEDFNIIITKDFDYITSKLKDLIPQSRALTEDIKRNRQARESATGEDEQKRLDTEYDSLLTQQAKLNGETKDYTLLLQVINLILDRNTKNIEHSLYVQIQALEAEKSKLVLQQQQLEIQQQINQVTEENRIKQGQAAGSSIKDFIGSLDPNKARQASLIALADENKLLEINLQLRIKEIELQKLKLKADLESHALTQQEHDDLLKIYNDEEVALTNLTKIQIDNNTLKQADQQVQSIRSLYENISSIFTDKTLNDFTKGIHDVLNGFETLADGTQQKVNKMKLLGGLLKEVFITGFVDAFVALGQAIAAYLQGQGSFLSLLGKFFGEMLISLGTQIIQLTQGAVALAAVQGYLIAGLPGAIGAAVRAEIALAPFTAIGIGLVAAGALLSGGGGASKSSSTNSSNSASSSAGASSQPAATYDPTKDPRYIYQKGLMVNIALDIRHDDGIIIKKVIKEVNRNGRLTNLIGNRQLGFGY